MGNSDILTNFSAGLITKFKALVADEHNSFWQAVNGQLFDGQAPAGASFPYSVFSVVSHVPERTFTEDHRNLLVQFSHFAETKAESKTIAAACNDLFDECAAFTITGATLIWMRLDNGQDAMPEDVDATESGATTVWHLPADYDVKISMS